MAQFPEIPDSKGKLHEVSARDPFLITSTDSVWVVKKGALDIFYLTLKDGAPYGARHHVCRMETGEAAIGISAEQSDTEIGLLAVPVVGTEVLEVSKKDFLDLTAQNSGKGSAQEYELLIENWLGKISTGVFKPGVPPGTSVKLKPGDSVKLDASGTALSSGGTVWIKPADDNLLLMEDTGYKILRGSFLPLSGAVWVEASAASSVECAGTAEVLKGQGYDAACAYFFGLIFSWLKSDLKNREQFERDRLEKEEEFEHKRFMDSFLRLAQVLKPDRKKEILKDVSPNHLFNACVIVGSFMGVEMKLDEGQKKGMKVSDPVRLIARASRVRERKVSLKGEWWTEDISALLGFLDDGSPVAIIPVGPRKYKLVNPADGSQYEITEASAAHIRKDAYTFYKPLPYEPVNFYQLFKFGLRECKRDIWTIFIVGLIGGLLGLLVPYFTGLIFKDIIPSSDRSQLNQLVYILIASAFATALFQVTRSIASLRVEGKLNSTVQAGIWDRLLKLPVPFFRDYTTGNLAVRALGVDQMLQLVTGVALTTIITSIFSSLNFFMLYYYDSSLAIWATILIFIVLGVIVFFEYSKLKYLRRSQVLTQNLSGLSYQLITGMSKIRVGGAERNAFSEWSKIFASERENDFKSGLVQNRLSVFFSFIPIVAMMFIFINIAFVKDGGTMDTGTFIGFNSAFTIFLTSMIALGQSLSSLMETVPIYENLRPIIETLPEVDDNKPEANPLKGEVEMSNIVFKYSKDAPEVLKGVSLKASPGEFVAVVGPSGAGKSTMFRMLLGFDKPKSGAVFYDGVDLSTLDLQSVRRQFGVVLQEGKLIPGPILTNIIGSSNLTIDDAWEAAEMAGIADDIKKMPMGMFTLIDDEADTISGGQKQRIMIARAIVHKPKIILFDEATSALDNISQDIVTDSVEKLNATRLVIAHRLSTVINADRLYVIDEGEVVEEGTYKELMAKKGKFYELAKRQLV